MKQRLSNFTIRCLKTANYAFLAGLWCGSSLLPAATIVTWDGGGGVDNRWSVAANWVGDTAPVNPAITENSIPSTRNDIVLTGSGTIVVDQPWAIHGLDFNAGSSLTLTGSTLYIRPIDDHISSHDTRTLIDNKSANAQIIENDIVSQIGGSIRASGGNITLKGEITLANNLDPVHFPTGTSGPGFRLNASGGKTIIIDSTAKITGSGGDSVAFAGGGTVILRSELSDYTRGNSLWSGVVKVEANSLSGSAGAFGSGTSALTMAANTDNATNYSPSLLTSAAVTIGRNITLTSRTLGTGTNSYTIGGDTAHISNYTGVISNSSTSATNVPAHALTITAAAGGRVNFNTITRTSTLATANDHVTKVGAGIAAYTGTSNYAGNTLVNAGTLLVNGTLSKTATGVSSVGGVVVSTNATLGGTGYIGRNVNINTGGILSPGDINNAGVNTAGLLTIDGNLVFDSTSSILDFDLGSGASDSVNVLGNLTLKGTLNVTDVGGFGAGSYKLFDYSGTLTFSSGDVLFGTGLSTPGFTYLIDTTSYANSVYLQVIPEPQMALLSMMGLGSFLLRRRRK